jgi:hypothetical protein
MNKIADVRARVDPELPVTWRLPNKGTAGAIKEAKKNKGVVVCQDANDLFKVLDF